MKPFVLLCAALAASSSFAAEEAATLSPIVVTPTGQPVPLSETLAAITVISRADIERAQVTDIAELLRYVAGVEIGRNGGPGQVTSVFIRGGESNHTLVLIDGIRVNPASAGGAALQNIAPEMIERIEVLRGPRATIYGSDAIAGVINIITRSPQGLHGDLTLRGGDYDTRDAAGSFSYGGEQAGVSVAAQHQAIGGFPSCSGTDQDRAFRNTSVSLKAQAKLAGVSLAARAWNAEGQAEYLDFCGFNTPLDQEFKNQVVAADASVNPAAAWRSTLSVSRMEDEIRQTQGADFVRTVRPRVAWDTTLSLDAQRLTLGLEVAREEVEFLSFGTSNAEDRDLFGGFIQDELNLGSHSAVLALAWQDHDAYGDRATWNAEYGYEFPSQTRLIAAAGTGFRAPDTSDRFGFGGNPDLKPETSKSYELGVRQGIGSGQSVELRGFWNDVDDLISVICVAGCDTPAFDDDVFQARNIDEYRNRGVELSYRIVRASWSAQVSGISQKPEDRATGQRLLRRADQSATAGYTRRFGWFEAGLDVLASGDRIDFGDTPLPGYVLVNLTSGARLGEHVRLQARLENLLDKDYQTAAGYNQPGRSVYGTVRYSF